jgi:hypothetical protein
MRKTICMFLLILGAGAAASGCVTINPWERGRLANPDMQFGGAEELAASEAHATEVREASSGGLDASGGGCGCN